MAKRHARQWHLSRSDTRHERAARAALQELVCFYDALGDEMKRLRECERAGAAVDGALYAYMQKVDAAYLQVMQGLETFHPDRERHALIVFADALQDMIGFIHHRRAQGA